MELETSNLVGRLTLASA